MPHSDLHKTKLKKNLTVLAIVFGICVLIWAITVLKIQKAEAAEILHCGAPSTYELETESNVDACDIYTRQLEYRDEAIKLREQIKKRSKHYAEPSIALRNQYRENLQALHDSISDDDAHSITAPLNE